MIRKIIIAIILAVVLAGAAVGYWIYSCESFLRETQVDTSITIRKGQTFPSVYNSLFGAYHTPPFFRVYVVKFLRIDQKIRYGYYEAKGISLRQFLSTILSGQEAAVKVTIPEGTNIFDIAKILAEKGLANEKDFIAACFDRELVNTMTGMEYPSMEGMLFPETYYIKKQSTPRDIISILYSGFVEHLPPSFYDDAERLGLTFYEALTLASIVQKETYDHAEGPMVASVFLNRLKKGMRLQADPTVIYGNYVDFNGNITKRDLQDRSNVYNTYRHGGLPPTPISNPGANVLAYAVNPAETTYLYFVADKSRKHLFSTTYEEHRQKVNVTQKQ